MATSVSIVGWHISPDAAVCQDCDKPAHYLVEYYDQEGFPELRNLCEPCLDAGPYEVSQDKVAQVFEDLGL